jgi:glycosyltransferase involved in cell wall biosynthesis
MVSNVPWRRELGAARGQIEVADELRKLGHIVERFDSRDAFGDAQPARWHRLFPSRFARRARKHVREHGRNFDVIEALAEDLPFSKRELGFDGLLVARSMGLHTLYEEYIRLERETWPERIPGTVVGKALHRLNVHRRSAACRRSLEYADLVRVLNTDEQAYVRSTFGVGKRCAVIPDGLSDSLAAALARDALPPAERLRRREVVFIGSWSLRKGAADWGQIVDFTRRLAPDTKFRFLGTGVSRNGILRDLRVSDVDWISVVPYFRAVELPGLLAGATVGALPSYIEGCPFGVLEQLGAGIPTIAYDAPGSRIMLSRFSRPLMAPRGDAGRFAKLLAEMLKLDERSYAELAAQCISVASEFRYRRIVAAILDVYAAASASEGAESRHEALDDTAVVVDESLYREAAG